MGWVIRGGDKRLADGVIRNFLPEATAYFRAAGYFHPSVFEVAWEEFSTFFLREGRLFLVCAPFFDLPTVNAFQVGLYGTEPVHPPKNSKTDPGGTTSNGFSLLAWGLREGKIHVSIAVPSRRHNPGLYHEKFGVFEISGSEAACFEGSANETGAAYGKNFERVRVYDSRTPDDWTKVNGLRTEFAELWKNRIPGLEVMSLHKALREGILRLEEQLDPELDTKGSHNSIPFEVPSEILRLPPGLVLREYQATAIKEWFRRHGQGIYAMATGTGKTVTALATATALRRNTRGPLVIVVVAPLLHLVDQWIEEMQEFGLDPIRCAEARSSWESGLRHALHLVNGGHRSLLSIAVTNATFGSNPFQSALELVRVRTLLIADEVHNLGGPTLRAALPSRVALRLGLSATPERWMDEPGTKALEEYFGKPVFQFGLREALQVDPPVLTPYRYFPVVVDMTPEEVDAYVSVTARLATIMSKTGEDSFEEVALPLLIKRARILGSAQGKLRALRDAIAPFRRSTHMLVYCGDGRSQGEALGQSGVDDPEDLAYNKQINQVVAVLGNELGMRVAKYTADTPPLRRRQLRDDFAAGKIQVLVAIRCLDEGVDIPETRRAFILASSTNPRQYVQRRGRILRVAEGKSRAEVFDFLVRIPPAAFKGSDQLWQMARRLTEREMQRVIDFAELAVNGPQARLGLDEVLEELRLSYL